MTDAKDIGNRASGNSGSVTVRYLGLRDYEVVWKAMKDFTNERNSETQDEIWLVEHPPVFTQGQAGKPEHLLVPGDIPVVSTDRGGQITYHGPGQLVAYPLLNLKRLKLGVRELVTCIENSVVAMLGLYGIESYPKADAPGVYVGPDVTGHSCDMKIASLGLRVRRGCSFHGVAININMDLEPFSRINPCGYAELQMTQVSQLDPIHCDLTSMRSIADDYANILISMLNLVKTEA